MILHCEQEGRPTMKTIGIVVPIFNAEPYLTKCIESILQQSYKAIKIMLVDDGSTDKSGVICEQYAHMDSRISVIHQENMGKNASRYRGLKELNCEYATFVDADDWIDEKTFEQASKYLEEDFDMISYGIIRYIDENYQFMTDNLYEEGVYKREDIEENIYPTMIWDRQRKTFGFDPSLCNKVVKRELLLDALKSARKMKIGYGDDIAVIYGLIRKIQSLMILKDGFYYHRQRNREVIADYFVDSQYYRKLLELYEHLVGQFEGDKPLLKQIDFFYTAAVSYHLKIYGADHDQREYLFPFHKIPVGKRLVLYGAAIVGQCYYEQIKKLNYGTVVAWIDRDYKLYKKLEVRSVDVLNTSLEYDYIVVAAKNKDVAESIIGDLINCNIDENKIVWSI